MALRGKQETRVGCEGQDTACGLCGARRSAEEHDACIANLPGVAYACCGHGVRQAYVSFVTGHVIRGQFDHVRTRLRARLKERKAKAKCP